MAALWLFALVVYANARASQAEPLRLVAEIDGVTSVLTDIRAGKFVAQESGGWRSAPLDGPVRIAGSLEANARFVFWKPGFSILHAPIRDTIPASERPWFGHVGFVGQSSGGWSPLGDVWSGSLPDPLVAILAWVHEGKIVQCFARRLPAQAVSEGFRVDQVFALSESEAAGFGVVLLWSKGRFLAPLPTYKDPQVEAAFHDLLFDRTVKLEAALAKGRDSPVGRERDTLLRHAIAAGAVKAVAALLHHGAQIEQPIEDSPLVIAAVDGRAAMVDLLLNALPAMREPPSFFYLARWGHDAIARRILARTPPTVEISDEAVEEALAHGFADLARELLMRVKLDPSRRRQHAQILVRQVQLGYVAAAQLFLEHHADPNVTVEGCTPLGEAVRLGETALVEPLLRAGARPDAVDGLGNTPLLYACLAGDLAVAERLLKAGANPKFKRKDGKTPLHFAASHADPRLVSLLLAADVDPTVSVIRPNPLEIALMTGANQTATTLAQAGARLDLDWPYHKHPLAAAVWLDVDLVVADVLARGWKPEGPIHGSWDALTVARLCGSTRSMALLTSHSTTSPAALPTLVPPAELDAPLKLLSADPAEDKREGRARNMHPPVVVITGFVDETGQFLCPRIARSTDGRLSFAALRSIPDRRYAPPRKHGAPVCVPATILISFAPSPRDVLDLGEVDTPPMAVSTRWPVASLGTYFNRKRHSTARNNSYGSEVLDIQCVIAKNGAAHSATIAQPTTAHTHEYLMRTVASSQFIPATRRGDPTPAYFRFVLDR